MPAGGAVMNRLGERSILNGGSASGCVTRTVTDKHVVLIGSLTEDLAVGLVMGSGLFLKTWNFVLSKWKF